MSVRTHGWGGRPPQSDEEARERLVDAATVCVTKMGHRASLADVAREAGVTRPTVYRYFDGPDSLFQAMSLKAAAGYLDVLVEHVAGWTDPLDLLVEIFRYALETVPSEPHVGFLLYSPAGRFVTKERSGVARDATRWLLRRLPVDWAAYGHTEETLDRLGELALRLIQSYMLEPEPQIPDYDTVRCWLAGAVLPLSVGPAKPAKVAK